MSDTVGVMDRIHREVETVHGSKSKEIELDDAHGGAIVLVPLQDRTILHPPPLHRDDLPQRALGNDHPARVDPEVPGEAVETPAHVIDELGREALRQLDELANLLRVPCVEILGEGVHLCLGQTECLSDGPGAPTWPDR